MHVFACAKYHPNTHAHTHARLKPNNKCGCSSTIHYACTDPGGLSTPFFLFGRAFSPPPELKLQDFTNGEGRANFKGWRLFRQIFPRCGIARTHAMQLSVWLDFTDRDSSALNVDRKSPQRPHLMPKVYRYLVKYSAEDLFWKTQPRVIVDLSAKNTSSFSLCPFFIWWMVRCVFFVLLVLLLVPEIKWKRVFKIASTKYWRSSWSGRRRRGNCWNST